MQVIEKFRQGKTGDDACEDEIFISPHFAAVIDGCTSKIPARYGRLSKGQMAAKAVTQSLSRLKADATLAEAAESLTCVLAEADPSALSRDAACRLACCAAIFSASRREIWLIGDCQARFGGTTYTNAKKIDRMLARIRADVDNYLLLHGKTVADLRRDDTGRRVILNALRQQCSFQNDPDPHNPLSYTVLDGTQVNVAHVPVLNVGNARQVILASDGYPTLCDTLCETERSLQHLLKADPLMIKGTSPATKGLAVGAHSFDDRAYLRFIP